MWLRGAIVIAIVLAIPAIFPRFIRAVDPGRARGSMEQALERRQRAGGDMVVLPSGETRRAVVYTAATPSADAAAAQQRGLVWWSRLLAAVFAAGLLRHTVRLLRRGDEAAAS